MAMSMIAITTMNTRKMMPPDGVSHSGQPLSGDWGGGDASATMPETGDGAHGAP
jgi:hypothetical protein